MPLTKLLRPELGAGNSGTFHPPSKQSSYSSLACIYVLRTLDGITRTLYTSKQAQKGVDGLHRLIIPFCWRRFVAPNRDKDWMLLENNDKPYSTCGKAA